MSTVLPWSAKSNRSTLGQPTLRWGCRKHYILIRRPGGRRNILVLELYRSPSSDCGILCFLPPFSIYA